MSKKPTIDAAFVAKKRAALALNQYEFWLPLGVTQSGGSRYEAGRPMPRPLRKLIYLMHVVGINAYDLEHIAKV